MSSPPPERDDDGSVDVEAAWADIVAHWDETQAPPERPASETPAPDAAGAETPASKQPDDPHTDDDWDVPRSRVGGERAREAAERDVDAEPDDERYHPPEPPPLPRGDMVSRLAWGGVLGAPLFFLIAALFWHSAPTWLVLAAVAAFVAGFVTLVVRMPDHREDDDDGAVV